jgi:hypothetical protein
MLIEPSAGNPVEEGFGNAIVLEPLNLKKLEKSRSQIVWGLLS